MALPSNDKIIGDLGHTADHNAIVDEIIFLRDNYLSASSVLISELLRKDSASSLYATIISPSFSGIPLAPTAASGTNTNQIATTQFVKTELSALVDFAPEALDTLKELADALGEDPNFATNIAQSLSNKLEVSTASLVYLTKSTASASYLPISASSDYLFLGTASATYLRKDTASATYLPISSSTNYLFVAVASATYLRQDTASATYLRKDTASETYLPISSSSNYLFVSVASATYLRQDTASSTYLRQDTASSTYLRQDTASSVYAPKISPQFSGTPIGPTPSIGTNNNQLATTAFVADAILQVQTGSAVDLSAYIRFDSIIDGGQP